MNTLFASRMLVQYDSLALADERAGNRILSSTSSPAAPRRLEQVVGHQRDRFDAVGGAVVLRLVKGCDDNTLSCICDTRPSHRKACDDHWKLRCVIDELSSNLLFFGCTDTHSLTGDCVCLRGQVVVEVSPYKLNVGAIPFG